MCKAVRINDQMQCSCGLSWDIDDSSPPSCVEHNKNLCTKTCKNLIESLGIDDKNQRDIDIYHRFDRLVAENGRLERIIAQHKIIRDPNPQIDSWIRGNQGLQEFWERVLTDKTFGGLNRTEKECADAIGYFKGSMDMAIKFRDLIEDKIVDTNFL